MMSWGVLVNEPQKCSTDVCFHVGTIWWIEPCYFSVTVPSCWRWSRKFDIFIEATKFKCIVICGYSFIEVFFTTRYIGYSDVDYRLYYFFGDSWWVF